MKSVPPGNEPRISPEAEGCSAYIRQPACGIVEYHSRVHTALRPIRIRNSRFNLRIRSSVKTIGQKLLIRNRINVHDRIVFHGLNVFIAHVICTGRIRHTELSGRKIISGFSGCDRVRENIQFYEMIRVLKGSRL